LPLGYIKVVPLDFLTLFLNLFGILVLLFKVSKESIADNIFCVVGRFFRWLSFLSSADKKPTVVSVCTRYVLLVCS
jgi:hypothetical protein